MAIDGISGVSSINIQGMDLETAMMAVQANRANLLETQQKDQISAVQSKNDSIAKLNQLLGVMNKIAATVPADAKAGDAVTISPELKAELTSAAKSAGITLPAEILGKPAQSGKYDVKLVDGTHISVDDAGKKEAEDYKARNWAFRSSDYSGKKGIESITQTAPPVPETKPNKGQIDGFVQQMKSQIDAASNTQQMDMLRLQSISNKRNEAFDVMTNFVKKMQESRSSIIGNMR